MWLITRTAADGRAFSFFDEYDFIELHLVDDKRRVSRHYNLRRLMPAFPLFLRLPQYLQKRFYQGWVQVILQVLYAVQAASSVGGRVYERQKSDEREFTGRHLRQGYWARKMLLTAAQCYRRLLRWRVEEAGDLGQCVPQHLLDPCKGVVVVFGLQVQEPLRKILSVLLQERRRRSLIRSAHERGDQFVEAPLRYCRPHEATGPAWDFKFQDRPRGVGHR